MKSKYLFFGIITMGLIMSCNTPMGEKAQPEAEFKFELEKFSDLRILRYQVTGFDSLSLQQKKLIYYLSQAAVCGRDILWDQNGKYNLAIRQTLKNIYETYTGNKETEEYKNFVVYLKRVWFSNGIYHHYSTDKIQPGISQEYFLELVKNSSTKGKPSFAGKTADETLTILLPVMFNPEVLPKKVFLDTSKDLVTSSAANFYEGVTEEEAVNFYKNQKNDKNDEPLSHGLNSKLVKVGNKVAEIKWMSGGLYGPAIDQIIIWLKKAQEVAENPTQKEGIGLLISYYQTGDLTTWDNYNINWVNDSSLVDFVNGFVEVYDDPLGRKGSWESIVNFKDLAATHRTETIASNAQWFEDHSPVDPKFKKEKVKGITAKVITASMLGGGCYPATPIGINLPNADWIRREHGSKSVTIENITNAYNKANEKSGFLEEFSLDTAEINLIRKYGAITDNLHTDLHECLGHASGKLLPGVNSEALKNYHSALEETRADLFALYYLLDPKLVELGLLPNAEAAKANYLSYIRNGLMTQLRRIEPGKNIEESHMRNRQLIAKWCFDKGSSEKIIELLKIEGKTFIRINDYEKLRILFGQLLAEVQRIKSEGDYTAGKALIENYGVVVDQEMLVEVQNRFEKLNIAPYSGFVNPEYEIFESNGEITDIKIKYVDDFATQMLNYDKNYSFLPIEN